MLSQKYPTALSIRQPGTSMPQHLGRRGRAGSCLEISGLSNSLGPKSIKSSVPILLFKSHEYFKMYLHCTVLTVLSGSFKILNHFKSECCLNVPCFCGVFPQTGEYTGKCNGNVRGQKPQHSKNTYFLEVFHHFQGHQAHPKCMFFECSLFFCCVFPQTGEYTGKCNGNVRGPKPQHSKNTHFLKVFHHFQGHQAPSKSACLLNVSCFLLCFPTNW